jgi:predicted DNA-binding transcriptional regulator YafY
LRTKGFRDPMSTEVGPVGRALLALEAIQAAPGITSARLAARLGVTDRAARRYVAMLREAGIPVESVSGPYGGYRIGRGARIPPLMFSTSEALGLVMAVLQGWHGSIEADHPAGTALTKILRVLPTAAAASAEAMRRVPAQNPSDRAAVPDADLTAAVIRACENRKRIRVAYRTGSRMLFEPWSVVVRHGRWYLLGWLPAADARRVLRLDHITAVETTDESCAPPGDLDAIREVEEHLADGWTHPVEVRIDAPWAKVAPCIPRTLGRLEKDGDRACTLRGTTDEPTWYAEQLAAIPAPFTVVSGDAVTTAVRTLAQRLADASEPLNQQPARERAPR